ncbi:MAG TPA: 2'-deoxycytidine 5'-triphosphate deaminase [Phycisphaerales bacterium]|nr:2'-deoxycytidine 5'-triphosphate deaminase [Phycisphaerales bacterium]
MSAGVLNAAQMMKFFTSAQAVSYSQSTKPELEYGASSIDIPLGSRYWIMKASCRPHEKMSLTDLINAYAESGPHPLKAGTELHSNHVYWIESAFETIRLPDQVCARATGKSSIGRLDTMVRLVAENEAEFDRISVGKSRRVLLEVVPITFSLIVQPGISLSQLRLIRGTEEHCSVSVKALQLEESPILVDPSGAAAQIEVIEDDPHAVLLRLDLSDDQKLGFCGWVAKQNPPSPIDLSKKKHYPSAQFWEPVYRKNDSVVIEQDRFYIFRSRQRFRVPGHLSVDCRAYSEGLGDIRIHYAGFAHPWFGYNREDDPLDKRGTPLIFEVRGFSMPTILHDASPLAKVYFRRMSGTVDKPPRTDSKSNSYTGQELTLSNYFS